MLEWYVFLVKNLRGVLAAVPDEDLTGWVEWLAKKFRYRDLGVPRCLVESHSDLFQGRLEGNPFHVLNYPTVRVHRAARETINVLSSNIDGCLAESILLASAYASPLHLTPMALKQLRQGGLVIHVFHGKPMDERMAKLHLRIVDYTVLDAYTVTIRHAVECIEGGCKPQEIVEYRKKLAEKDEKRYWRLKGGNLPIIAYIDYVHKLVEERAGSLLVGPEERVLLALLAGVNLAAIELGARE